MITKKIKTLIENNPLAFSTTNKDNTPNVIGVACVKIISDNQIIITDNFMKTTKENILKNNNVCLAVWNKEWKGYKLTGHAEYFKEGNHLKFVKNLEDNKDMPAKGAILVTISEIIKLS